MDLRDIVLSVTFESDKLKRRVELLNDLTDGVLVGGKIDVDALKEKSALAAEKLAEALNNEIGAADMGDWPTREDAGTWNSAAAEALAAHYHDSIERVRREAAQAYPVADEAENFARLVLWKFVVDLRRLRAEHFTPAAST